MQQARLDFFATSPETAKRLYDLSVGLHKGSIETSLIDLVSIRTSQLNGCTYCVDVHVKEAKIHGERELRVHHLTVWRESALFSARERAALEWTETLTLVAEAAGRGIEDALYARAREQFSDREISDLTFIISVMNTWNRLCIAFRKVPGSSDVAQGLLKAGLN
jgi:AhpD family alkylhydroperoxidase